MNYSYLLILHRCSTKATVEDHVAMSYGYCMVAVWTKRPTKIGRHRCACMHIISHCSSLLSRSPPNQTTSRCLKMKMTKGRYRNTSAMFLIAFLRLSSALLIYRAPHTTRRRSLSPFCAEPSREAFSNHHQLPVVFAIEDLNNYAHNQGLEITLTTLGPGFRSTARSLQNRTEILGYVEGFVRGNVLHLDKMEVFRKILKNVRKNDPNFKGGGTSLGVGLLMGYACVLHGQEAGCQVAEFLAIDDDDFLHKRLVRYYSAAGLKIVKYVGDDFRDIPDRLVWGGCGTLMRRDIDELLSFWSGLLNKSINRNIER